MSDPNPTLKDRELAGYVAPIIRSTDERVLRRKVTTYDRESGEVTGEVTMREVVGGLAKATALGLEVVEGVRPKEFSCDGCGRVLPVPKRGSVTTTCKPCKAGGQTECPCGCGEKPPARAFTPSAKADRGGASWGCYREAARRRQANLTPEQRREAARKANAGRTSESRAEARLRVMATWAARTSEQRSEAVLKSWTTRRANAAKGAAE